MAGFCRKTLLAGLALLATTSSAQAWWVGWRGWGYGPAYYGPAYYGPVYAYYPVYPAYPPCAMAVPPLSPNLPVPQKPALAKPTTTKETPPLGDPMKKGPTITEARSMGGASAKGTGDRCKVGFWNLTGHDVTLKIDGQPRLLPRDRAVTLDLGRAFVYQVDQGEVITERVPGEQPFHEVILRQ